MRLFIILCLSLMFHTTANAQDAAKGAWARGDGAVKVVVAPCGTALCMTNTWTRPDGDETVGDYVVMNLKPVAAGSWSGRGSNPKRNLEFSVEMKVDGDHMTTGGCVLGGIICRTRDWTRIK